MRNIKVDLNRFAGDRSGSIAILFGLSSFVLFGLVAIALDISRVHNSQQRVQTALDAAALAAAKMLNDENATDTEVRDKAEAYMQARLIAMRVNDAGTNNLQVDVDRENFSVTISTDIQVSSYFGRLAQSTGVLDFTESSTVVYQTKKIELAMALDMSGSMNNNDANGIKKIDSLKQASEDIINILAGSTSAKDSIRVAVAPYTGSVNAGPYQAVATGGPHSDTCVVDRPGANAYDDQEPGPGAYSGTSTAALRPGDYTCPSVEILPLTDVFEPTSRSVVINRVQSLYTDWDTSGHIGLAWSWYMISHNWKPVWPPTSDPEPNDPKVIKAVLLMTDGVFQTAYNNGDGTLAVQNSGNPSVVGTSAYQALQLCQNMKNDGVIIYAVGFMAPSASEQMLRDCSGDDNFFDADNGAELREAFQTIGDRLTSLHITQ